MPESLTIVRAEAADWPTLEPLARQHGLVIPGASPQQWLEDGCLLLGRYAESPTGMLFLDPKRAELQGRPRFSDDFSRRSGRRLVDAAERRAVQFGLLALDVLAVPADEPFWAGRGYIVDHGAPFSRAGQPLLRMHRSFPRRQTQYGRRIAALLKDLGIPRNYGAERRLALQPECLRLASIGTDIHGREQRMFPGAAMAWLRMQREAQQQGIVLQPVSAWRDVAYQEQIVRRKRDAGQSISEILKVSAAPGFSEHHSGRALDITTPGSDPLETCFEETEAFRWLKRHAPDHGFRMSYPRNNRHDVAYEPWHWYWAG